MLVTGIHLCMVKNLEVPLSKANLTFSPNFAVAKNILRYGENRQKLIFSLRRAYYS
ncbi:hypothetical protein RvY_06282 [Ramazzottius varieornatus]|uniref:Uncharacterized protein n=1 Tax=Ramazzottius varieornatus TaxID=947166 RepID=A0A1D1UYL1_RAMVA|nr:hypothetical protein RvY_06282 [Ramazzottius varieornatus]